MSTITDDNNVSTNAPQQAPAEVVTALDVSAQATLNNAAAAATTATAAGEAELRDLRRLVAMQREKIEELEKQNEKWKRTAAALVRCCCLSYFVVVVVVVDVVDRFVPAFFVFLLFSFSLAANGI